MKDILISVSLFALLVAVVGWLQITQDRRISTVIAPHHDIVADVRRSMFEEIADEINGKTIILVSPNHYNAGNAIIQTRLQTFDTRDGAVEVDHDLLAAAEELGAVQEFGGFSNEHGIYTILPDIAAVLPDSKVLPLVIKPEVSEAEMEDLVDGLHGECGSCVMVASADFSHYQPFALSELHDRSTIRALQDFDTSFITNNAEVGPPHILSIGMMWADKNRSNMFELFDHTNSTSEEQFHFSEGTSHVFGWYEWGATPSPTEHVSFTFVGDVSVSGSVAQVGRESYEDVVSQLGDRVLWGSDLTIGNLEGPLTELAPVNELNLVQDPAAAPVYSFLRFNALMINNNHIRDAGDAGVSDTQQNLEFFDIEAFGLADTPSVSTGDGLELHVLGYNTENPDPDFNQKITDFEDKDSRTVVYVHWGRDFQVAASDEQRSLAESWIEAGADLVIGTGSHVISEVEIHKKVPIIYGLGNFLFDDSFNPDKQGLVISGEFSDDSLTILPSLIRHDNSRPVLWRNLEANSEILDIFQPLEPFLAEQRGGISFTIVN